MKRFNSQAIPPEHARLHVALLEVPISDDYLDHQIWQHVDEFFRDPEKPNLARKNGYRVGQIVGAPPERFQQTLLSPFSCASKAMIFPPGRVMSIPVGPIRPRTSYQIVQGEKKIEVALEQAGFMLDVVADFTSEGTRLTFTPKVENNEASLPFRARPDQSSWELATGRANRDYPEMSWEVTLAPNRYLLIGGRADRPGTLGRTAFVEKESGVQRMLVIRNCRPLASMEMGGADLEEWIRAKKSTPLALQASIQKR